MKSLLPLCLGILCLYSFSDAHLVSSNQCTSGPQYWCATIRNAKECKAVKHCIQTVWEKQILPEDNDNVCSICKEMVKEARDQLQSNETQEEIKEVFVRSCMLIPVKTIVKECIKLSYEFIPELIDTLASQMDPLAVCSTAGLCNNPYVDRMLLEYEEKNRDVLKTAIATADTCLDCKNFIKDVSKTVRTHSRADVLNHLLAICGRLSSLSEGCMALVQDNFQMIYDFLSSGLRPNEVCDLFGMCPRMYGDTTVIMPKTGDEPCDFCVAVVNSWRNNLIANTTKEEFKTILSGLCHQTGKFENECLSLVDQYFEVFYDVLVSEIDPKDICKTLGLCGPNSVFNSKVPVWTTLQIRPEDHLPLVPLRPSFDEDKLIGLDEARSYKEERFLPRVSLTKSSVSVVTAGKTGFRSKVELSKGDECIMCEFVLHFLQNVLSDGKTRKEIESEVENVCKLFPHSIREQCQDYIEAYGDQLIQLIVLQMDPATICPMLKLCPGSGLEASVNTKPTCVLCEFVMTELDQVLEDKDTEESIKKAVDKVCNQLPKSIRKQCVAFVDTYVDQIVDLLVHDFTPAQICAQLGLCPGNKISPLPAPENAQLPARRLFVNLPAVVTYEKTGKKVKQSPQCVLCEFIIARLDSLLIDGATAKDIEEAIDSVCELMPSTVKVNCLSFMKEYGNSIIEALFSHIAPKFICTHIQLCRAHIPAGLVTATVKFPNDRCKVCEVLVDWVKDSLTVKDSDMAIVKILKGVCDEIPGETPKEICIDMTLKYGPFLSKLLRELKETKLVCQSIKECPLDRPKELLGSKKCTWGPSYWCKSKKHAESCGATQHCIEKVWLDGIPAA